MSMPAVVVFDLDGTLWAPEMYELWGGGAPFKAHHDGSHLTDARGQKVELIGASRRVLESLIESPPYLEGALQLAFASTCDEPSWARECLTKFKLRNGDVTMGEVFAHHEIYKARDKTVHFREIRKKSGASFEDMIFFDNQMNNINDVAPLGVHVVYCPDGVTQQAWVDGLEGWRMKRGKAKV